jgi:polar amino acid transport system substrate-binding protein
LIQINHAKGVSEMRKLSAIVALVFALGSALQAHAQQSHDPRVADLVQAGVLRFGLGLGTPMTAIKNPTTGEVKGVALELGRALAARIGVKFTSVEYPRPGAVIDGLRANAWDVSMLVFDPERAQQVDFSNAYLQSDLTYLVPPGSSIHSVADVDKPGIRIAVPRGDGSDLYLTRTLKHAELIRTDSHAAAVDLLRTGGADAKSSPRPVLMEESSTLPGSRVLDDGYAEIYFAALVPKGQTARLTYVNEFIEDAKASGLVGRIIEAIGLQGVRVAPAGSLSINK